MPKRKAVERAPLLRKIPIEIIVGILIALAVIAYGVSRTFIHSEETSTGESIKGLCIIYGESICPHCNELKNFFKENGIPYIFRDIALNTSYLAEFYNITKIAGLEAYVPLTIVLNEGYNLTAIVQGAVTDKEFWLSLLNKTGSNNVTVYSLTGVKRLDSKSVNEIYYIAVTRYGISPPKEDAREESTESTAQGI